MIERKTLIKIGETTSFCCNKLEKLWIIKLLRQLEDGTWYIEPVDPECDYIYLDYCPFCGEPIYEES